MGTRGKRSAASLAVVPVSLAQRADPWPNLQPAEADYWRNIVASLPADWFRPSDLPLLAAYCRAAAAKDEADARLLAEPAVLEHPKSGAMYPNPNLRIADMYVRQMAQLAGKLRLCPSSRYDAQKAAGKGRRESPESKPWEFRAGAK